MAFNCYRGRPEPWQSRTSLPLAAPVSRHSQRSPIVTGNSACHTHAFFRSHGRRLWRTCRKASAGHAFIRRRRRRQEPPAPLGPPCGKAGRRKESPLTWVLAIHARAGSPGHLARGGQGILALRHLGAARHRRAGNRVWRPREATGRRCHATWHTVPTSGTARTPARSSHHVSCALSSRGRVRRLPQRHPQSWSRLISSSRASTSDPDPSRAAAYSSPAAAWLSSGSTASVNR